jgi:GT2 family glycosyltransferase
MDQAVAVAANQAGSVAREGVRFDEEAYLRLNPDVRLAVAAGTFRSGFEHFQRFGGAEGRLLARPDGLPRDRIVLTTAPETRRGTQKPPACAIDMVKISPSGGVFLVGWVDDALDRVDSVDLYLSGWMASFDGAGLARLRRPDTEAALNSGGHAYGFWGFLFAARGLAGGACSVVLRLKSGAETHFLLAAEPVADDEMRRLALSHIAGVQYLGNPYFAAVAAVAPMIGAQLVDFNKLLSRRAASSPYVERFGARKQGCKGSIIVCLYGRPEYVFLQAAMFSAQPGMEDYEFVYVVNSFWIAEAVLKEARRAARIYGLDITVVVLAANAGFGAANNAAVEYAASDRLLLVNPDVFPRDDGWIDAHTAVVAERPEAETRLFGVPLYYDDGALMHAGMYFELDTLPALAGGRLGEAGILRVEHYGKGAPPETPHLLSRRKVPAVSGAFMSVARPWFETLGGFSQDYVFGHYEDADFCLRSLEGGCPAWLHDLRLWHLEGKGGVREPQHEGAAVVNRGLFTESWKETALHGLLGPAPDHESLQS